MSNTVLIVFLFLIVLIQGFSIATIRKRVNMLSEVDTKIIETFAKVEEGRHKLTDATIRCMGAFIRCMGAFNERIRTLEEHPHD